MDRRIVAATELLLIFPAALFLTAVVARYLEPLRFAQEINPVIPTTKPAILLSANINRTATTNHRH